jgi:hypothetical protein
MTTAVLSGPSSAVERSGGSTGFRDGQRFRDSLRDAALALAFFAGVQVGFLALLVLLFELGVFSSITILFYRCIALCGLTAVVVGTALLWSDARLGGATIRDRIAATLVAASLSLTFLALGPVTVDRSISIFINGHMAAQPARIFTAAEIDQAFRERYLTGMDQIARRMEEQRVTGTIERVGDGYRIAGKGHGLIASSRLMARLFGADARLLDGPGP